MNPLFASLVALSVVQAADTANRHNPVFESLRNRGVPMPNGGAAKLPPPFLPEGLTGQQQHAQVVKVLRQMGLDETQFFRNAPVAPFALDLRSMPDVSPTARAIDFAFVAYGDWKTVTSQAFLQALSKSEDAARKGNLPQSASLPADELAKRHIVLPDRPGETADVFFVNLEIFDRVQLRTTWNAVVNRNRSVLMAAQIDPRFTHDPQYPNQWSPIELNEAGDPVAGKPRPYTAAGFYFKATQMDQPAGAIFFECHIVYDEPQGWFNGANLLRSKLPLVVQSQVRAFRRRLANPQGP